MTKIDLADMITEEVEKQAQEPVEPLGSTTDEVEAEVVVEPEPKRKKPVKKAKAKPDKEAEEQEKVAVRRRTTWLREDHLNRLEALKLRDRARLRDDPEKRVAVTTLIDEAIEKYLAEMEKGEGVR